MEEDQVEIVPKKWIKWAFYIGGPLFLILAYDVLDAFLFESEGEQLPLLFEWTMILACSIGILGVLFGIPHFYRFKITIDGNGILQEGIFSRHISYENIQRMKVRKGFVEIYDGNILNIISIGDLYTNFRKGVEVINNHLVNRGDINFKGKEKYIEEYFQRP